MISYFVSLLALMLIQITHVTSQELSLRRVKFDEFDRDEREFLANLNRSRVAKNWLGIELNDELTDAAQQEAERLATLGRLELPRFNLANSYYGFSFKLNGKIANVYGLFTCSSLKRKISILLLNDRSSIRTKSAIKCATTICFESSISTCIV